MEKEQRQHCQICGEEVFEKRKECLRCGSLIDIHDDLPGYFSSILLDKKQKTTKKKTSFFPHHHLYLCILQEKFTNLDFLSAEKGPQEIFKSSTWIEEILYCKKKSISVRASPDWIQYYGLSPKFSTMPWIYSGSMELLLPKVLKKGKSPTFKHAGLIATFSAIPDRYKTKTGSVWVTPAHILPKGKHTFQAKLKPIEVSTSFGKEKGKSSCTSKETDPGVEVQFSKWFVLPYFNIVILRLDEKLEKDKRKAIENLHEETTSLVKVVVKEKINEVVRQVVLKSGEAFDQRHSGAIIQYNTKNEKTKELVLYARSKDDTKQGFAVNIQHILRIYSALWFYIYQFQKEKILSSKRKMGVKYEPEEGWDKNQNAFILRLLSEEVAKKILKARILDGTSIEFLRTVGMECPVLCGDTFPSKNEDWKYHISMEGDHAEDTDRPCPEYDELTNDGRRCRRTFSPPNNTDADIQTHLSNNH